MAFFLRVLLDHAQMDSENDPLRSLTGQLYFHPYLTLTQCQIKTLPILFPEAV